MQRYILSNKNKITLISGILIVFGFIGRFAMNNITIFTWSLIIASILGLAPIAIQAYQALRVKVVSIDSSYCSSFRGFPYSKLKSQLSLLSYSCSGHI